ncbi:MAG: site-specific DNA-methyltransferase [Candidatus Methylomirabilota bacterium]|nr:MAG: site-specific DNA-methyltransferase [candidate division NC10 bacterium]
MDRKAPVSAYRQVIPTEGRLSEGAASYGRPHAGRQLGFDFVENVRTGNGFRDPAFSDNKTQPLHRWVPWIAGFSAQFVQDCFETFLKDRRRRATSRVLDPFAGVGTTLVQSLLSGFDCLGFEINPYAALACKAKLNSPKLDLEKLEAYCLEYQKLAAEAAQPGGVQRPAEFETRIPFFSPSVEAQVLAFLNFAEEIPDPDIADLFRVAFGSVMVSFSNYTYEPSLGSRPGAGKPLIEKADVHSTILRKLFDMVSDIRWIKPRVEALPSAKGQVYNLDFLETEDLLPACSVDLMVTSPPYMNNYHYVRNTRPQLFWLSLVASPKELRRLEEANFGKYWQTVRSAKPLDLQFDHPELARTLARLRQTRTDKGPYGGPGWANYVTAYFNDCDRFCRVLKRALARRGIGVVVIGNSIIQGHEIKTDLVLADIARHNGFELMGVQQIRTKRVGASITTSAVRRGERNQATLYESAVIVRKR